MHIIYRADPPGHSCVLQRLGTVVDHPYSVLDAGASYLWVLASVCRWWRVLDFCRVGLVDMRLSGPLSTASYM